MNGLLQDVRYALRQLRKQPGLAAIIVLTLGLGVGANTAIFSVLNGWLLRPLPVMKPEQIVVLASQGNGGSRGKFSYLDLQDFRKQAETFSALYAYEFGAAGLTANGKANEFVYSAVTGNYFSALGLRPALGRLSLPGEGETPGEPLFVVLDYSFWQRKLAGDPGIVGKQVLFNGKSATVIGVAPRGFHGSLFAFEMDGYVPLSAIADSAESHLWTDREDRELFVQGRLKPGVSLVQARNSVGLIAKRLANQYPVSNKGITVRVIPESLARPAPLVASFAPIIAGMFLTLAGLVLLLACVNVAGIFLARASGRQHEMAVRAAVGAGPGRLIRQVLTESLLVAALGGVAGALIGDWALTLAGSLLYSVTTTPNFGYHMDCPFDLKVFAYTLAAAVLTGVVVGMWPALRARRTDVNATLHRAGPAGSSGGQRFRSALVVGQLAGSLMLLVVAGLFVRSLAHAERTYLGFDPDHVLTVLLDPHQIGYDQARANGFYQELRRRLESTPGVQAVSFASALPMEIPGKSSVIYLPSHPLAPEERPPSISSSSIDPAYFGTMRTPVLRGRAFADSDNVNAPAVAIVNQAMANQLWPNEDAIGRRFSLKGSAGPFLQVVGIADDGQYLFVSPDRQPYFYLPLKQNNSSFRSLLVRTSVPPESLIPVVQEQIRSLAPDLPLIDVRSMEQVVQGLGGLFIFRLAASLAAVIGILGLVLAVVGVYGVVAYSAAQRTSEFGIRMALGARPGHIAELVLRQGVWLVSVGALIGLLAAGGLAHAMKKLVVGIGVTDPLTFVTVTLLLAGTALLACYIPARRAAKVDPIVALRYE
jgi:predicted permease